MNEWRYAPEDAWTAMHAIAETLKRYLDEYIIGQFGYDKKEGCEMEIDLLRQEITVIMARIERLREKL